jgi:hypothetical protein
MHASCYVFGDRKFLVVVGRSEISETSGCVNWPNIAISLVEVGGEPNSKVSVCLSPYLRWESKEKFAFLRTA